MKKGKMLLVSLVVVLLFVCVGVPSWAYKIDVKSNLAPEDGMVDMAAYWVGPAPSSMDFVVMPGETTWYENSDWTRAGLCWSKVSVKRADIPAWKGCSVSYFEKSLARCGNAKVTLKRSGCNIDINIE